MIDPNKPHEQASQPFTFAAIREDLLSVEAGFWELRSQLEKLYGLKMTATSLQRAGIVSGTAFASAFAFDVSVQVDEGNGLENTAITDLDRLLSADRPSRADLSAEAFRSCLSAYQREGLGQFDVEEMVWPSGFIRIQGVGTFEALMAERWRHRSELPICAYTSGVLLGFAKGVAGRADLLCVETACQAKGDLTCQFEISADTGLQGTGDELQADAFGSQEVDLLDSLFFQIPLGAAIFDQDLRLRHHNSNWDRFMESFGQMPAAHMELSGALTADDGLPATFLQAAQRALSGESVRLKNVPFEHTGEASGWDMICTPLKIDDAVIGILHMVIDVARRAAQ